MGSPALGLGDEPLAFFNSTATATRGFAQALVAGDVFRVAIDTPAAYDDYSGFGFPFAIIAFRDDSGMETLKLEAGSSQQYGDFPWRFTDATHTNADLGVVGGTDPIAPTATSDGSMMELELIGNTTARVSLDGVAVEVGLSALLRRSIFRLAAMRRRAMAAKTTSNWTVTIRRIGTRPPDSSRDIRAAPRLCFVTGRCYLSMRVSNTATFSGWATDATAKR